MADVGNLLNPAHLQNYAHDGRWPYYLNHEPSIEATAWCAIACRDDAQTTRKSLEFLLSAQNEDGGWSTKAGTKPSDWSTGLALLSVQILQQELAAKNDEKDRSLLSKTAKSADDAAIYLLRTRADFINDFTRVMMFVLNGPDFDYPRGWSWTTNTFHWIEPTSYAVLALQRSPQSAQKRYALAIDEAKDYMLEKVCHSGGWNYGVPMAVGTKLPSQVVPTAWALMALHNKSNEKINRSVKYLQDTDDVSANTLQAQALSILALSAHGMDVTDRVKALTAKIAQHDPFFNNLFIAGLCTVAAAVPQTGNPLLADNAKGKTRNDRNE